MDEARSERVAATARSVRTSLGPAPDPGALQRHLHGSGVHGMDAVLVTMQVLGVGWSEANASYFGSPLRSADRDLQNAFLDALELAAGADEEQRRLCADHGVPWTPPPGGSVVRLGPGVDRAAQRIGGVRPPARGTSNGWHLWAGGGGPAHAPAPGPVAGAERLVAVEEIYEPCPQALPFLGLPPGRRFAIGPDGSTVGEDPALPTA